MDYNEFLKSKIVVAQKSGFNIDLDFLHPDNKDHQNAVIQWAVWMGKALLGLEFGLGKTTIQEQIAYFVHKKTGKKFLVICPLGVKHQFIDEDGPRLGMVWKYVKTDDEILNSDTPFLVTNYERVRDGNITSRSVDTLGGVSLDEGSVLRNLGSKTSDVFKRLFKNTEYRYVATATPAPNDYKELIYYSEFLGVMDHGQALTRFFKRDSQKAGHLTLMPSQEETFWHWVATWALFLSYPSDLGFDDTGYVLPEINVHYERIPVDHHRAWEQMDDRGQRRMLVSAANGISAACEEKRETMTVRVQRMKEIMQANPGRNWLLWHNLEDERRAIEAAIPEAVSVYGSQDLELREKRILQFSRGEIPILATKPEIAGSGCNFQKHCYSAIFVGITYKFEEFIQAVHRIQRFLQNKPVDIWIIYAESEEIIINTLKKKWQQHNTLVERMRGIIRKYNLSNLAIQNGLSRSIGVDRVLIKGKLFNAIRNDCVLEVAGMPDNSVDLIHTSIPFGNHYEYTTLYNDFGHNATDAEFWAQMKFLIPELLRVLKPGRVAAIHVKDRQLYGHQTTSGIMETAPFSDECVMAFREAGFTYQGRCTIVTDVVRENNSTYRLGYTEMTNDSSKMSFGLPEYLLLFRKKPSSNENARADEPIKQVKGYEDGQYSLGRWQIDAHSLWRSSGNRHLTPEELAVMRPDIAAELYKMEQLAEPYEYERHVAICDALEKQGRLPRDFMLLPPKVTRGESDFVWDDVISMRTLNSQQSRRNQDNHICPLPLDIVERVIRRWSMPGELVLDPFAGLFTVPYCAIKMGRRALGVELNQDYYYAGVRYCQDAEQQTLTPTLFDLLEMEEVDVKSAS